VKTEASRGKSLGLYWGGVAVASALAAPWAREAASLVPACLFYSWTGLPCPTCGGTHAAVALSRLDFAGAFAANPLAAAAGILFFGGGAIAGAAALAGRPLREPHLGPRARGTAILALAINWVYLLIR
jgi:uncharacterized protein DUF2752